MRRLLFSPILLVSAALVGCTTVDADYSYSRPYVPTVGLPGNLDQTEQRLRPEIENVFEEAGYRVTQGRETDYDFDFSVEAGAVNADVTMMLFRGRREIVRAYARSGGARMLFRRSQVIRDAFEKCLGQFEARLSQANRYDSPPRRGGYDDRWGPGGRRDDFRSDEDHGDERTGSYDDRR
jgi:hypothetical protein